MSAHSAARKLHRVSPWSLKSQQKRFSAATRRPPKYYLYGSRVFPSTPAFPAFSTSRVHSGSPTPWLSSLCVRDKSLPLNPRRLLENSKNEVWAQRTSGCFADERAPKCYRHLAPAVHADRRQMGPYSVALQSDERTSQISGKKIGPVPSQRRCRFLTFGAVFRSQLRCCTEDAASPWPYWTISSIACHVNEATCRATVPVSASQAKCIPPAVIVTVV